MSRADTEPERSGELSYGFWATASQQQPVNLELRDVTVRFGGVTALNSVNASVRPGEVVAVIGPNGAGKSTLLNAISGVLGRNATGSIRIGDHEIGNRTSTGRAYYGIGRSFQDPPLLGGLTAVENVMVGSHVLNRYNVVEQVLRWRKTARAERDVRERAERLLDFVGMGALAQEPAAGIPYGPRKLIDVARALLCGPRLLLLDEPTSGLDRGEQETMMRILRYLRGNEQLAVLVVEHHMDIVRNCTSRVIGLAAGETVADGPTEEVLDSEQLRTALVSK